MRARRLVRRLVGLPLFVGLLLGATPALATLRSTAAPPSTQAVSSGTWRLVFSTTPTPASPSGSITVAESATTYVYLVNSGSTGIPVSYPVAVTMTSTDNASMTLTACVGGTWTNATTCSGTSTAIGSTSGVTRFTTASLTTAGATTLPAGQAVHVKVANTSVLGGINNGTTTPSVTVTSV